MSAVFFDTNILVYAADAKCDQPAKRDVARTLVFSRRITVSTQVLMELYSALRRKLNFDHSAAMNWVQMLTKETVVEPTAKDMVAAIRMAQRFKISHWDGLILTAAIVAGSELIYTEDLSHGQVYDSVKACNPFVEDFLAS